MTDPTKVSLGLRSDDVEEIRRHQFLIDHKDQCKFYRDERVVIKQDPKICIDSLNTSKWEVQHAGLGEVILQRDGAFAVITASGKPSYANFFIKMWAGDKEVLETEFKFFMDQILPFKIDTILFDLEWRFTVNGKLQGTSTVEQPTSVLDEAYPTLKNGVDKFINDYLEAEETILILQGPPGMGKTRLVRAILREMTVRKGERASAIYSGDATVWESDEVFIHFISGSYDVLLIEDADHMITPRSSGNKHLHRFLNISDGIAQAQGRKIIFSTNLPSINSVDDALVRPGRCFMHMFTRNLDKQEAKALMTKVGGSFMAMQELERESGSITVAKVYAIHRKHGGATEKLIDSINRKKHGIRPVTAQPAAVSFDTDE